MGLVLIPFSGIKKGGWRKKNSSKQWECWKKKYFFTFFIFRSHFFFQSKWIPKVLQSTKKSKLSKKTKPEAAHSQKSPGIRKILGKPTGRSMEKWAEIKFFPLGIPLSWGFWKISLPWNKKQILEKKNPQKCQVDFSGFEGVMENFGGKNPIFFFFGVGNSWNWNEPNSNLINPLNFLIAPQKGDFSTQTISKSK